MKPSHLLVIFSLVVLIACGTTPQAAEQPTSAPQVITQVVVVTATAPPATPTRAATVTPTPKPTNTPKPTATPVLTGKWQVETEKSSFDDSATVFLTLEANADITGPIGNYRPALLLRCKEKETEAFFDVGMQPDLEGLSDTATVRLRLDQEKAYTIQAGKSTSGNALFVHDPKPFIEQLLKHKQLVMGFTPFSAAPVETTFDLGGLDEAIKPLREACP